MIPTIDSAKELANKYFSKLDSDKKEFFMLHSETVGTAAIALAPDTVDKESIKIASWIHDIGRVVDIPTHPLKSLEVAQGQGLILNDTIQDCILNHGKDGMPKTIEGKFFRIADKACVFDTKTLELCKKQNNFDFLEKMSLKANKLFREMK